MDKTKTREEMEAMLKAESWKLVYSDRIFDPANQINASVEIWEKHGNPYQIRLLWPRHGDCNGATTTEIEIEKALYIMGKGRSR